MPDPPPLPAPVGLEYDIQGTAVVLTWDSDDSTFIMYYSIDKSLDTSFTSNVETYFSLTTNFIDSDVEQTTTITRKKQHNII